MLHLESSTAALNGESVSTPLIIVMEPIANKWKGAIHYVYLDDTIVIDMCTCGAVIYTVLYISLYPILSSKTGYIRNMLGFINDANSYTLFLKL